MNLSDEHSLEIIRHNLRVVEQYMQNMSDEEIEKPEAKITVIKNSDEEETI